MIPSLQNCNHQFWLNFGNFWGLQECADGAFKVFLNDALYDKLMTLFGSLNMHTELFHIKLEFLSYEYLQRYYFLNSSCSLTH